MGPLTIPKEVLCGATKRQMPYRALTPYKAERRISISKKHPESLYLLYKEPLPVTVAALRSTSVFALEDHFFCYENFYAKYFHIL